jgi:hypothetical protein
MKFRKPFYRKDRGLRYLQLDGRPINLGPVRQPLRRRVDFLGRPQPAFHGALDPAEAVRGLFAGEMEAPFRGRQGPRQRVVAGGGPGVPAARERVLVPAVRQRLGRGRLGPLGKGACRLRPRPGRPPPGVREASSRAASPTT